MIHFACLYGVKFDRDLLEHFAGYYRLFNFDTYKVFIHNNCSSQDLSYATRIFYRYDYEYEIINDDFYNSGLRNIVMNDYRKTLDPEDYLFTVDSDEQVDIPLNVKELIYSYDILKGKMVDRYDFRLHDAYPDPCVPLSVQYPLRGEMDSIIREKFRNADIDFNCILSCPREKILSAKVKHAVNYCGSHFHTEENLKECETIFTINHYTWKSTIIDRMANRDYVPLLYIELILQYFNLENYTSPALEKKRELDRNIRGHGSERPFWLI